VEEPDREPITENHEREGCCFGEKSIGTVLDLGVKILVAGAVSRCIPDLSSVVISSRVGNVG
jgi:hypothetical protein